LHFSWGKGVNDLITQLINIINEGERETVIPDAIKIGSTDYHFVINIVNNHALFAIGNESLHLNQCESYEDDPRVAGWIAQGTYTIGNVEKKYSNDDHWGLWISSKFRGTGLSDFLYNIKALVDNQFEFEFVDGTNYAFLTTYIKKGYIPYSVIIPPELNERLLSEEDKQKIIAGIKSQKNHIHSQIILPHSLKLKLEPEMSIKMYQEIQKK
jgi:hypothetical protein